MGGHVGGVWEWDGHGWSKAGYEDPEGDGNPPLTPNSNPALTYDPIRKCAVLAIDDETWEWNGVSWANRSLSAIESAAIPNERWDHVAGYDGARGQALMFGGFAPIACDETWTVDSARAAAGRPAHVLRVRLAAASPSGNLSIREISGRWTAGGTGFPGGMQTHGVTLSGLARHHNYWFPLADGTASAVAPAEVTFSTEDPALLDSLLASTQKELAIAVTPPASGTGVSAVASGYMEVTVAYARTP